MEIRPYRQVDCPAISRLFYDAVHHIREEDYTPVQLDAWATGTVDLPAWNTSFLAHHTLVAQENNRLIGFADMDESGYLDRLYVHPCHQRQGVATALVDALETAARAAGVSRFTVHASITARPFFEQRGYQVCCRQTVERRGVELVNYQMGKPVKG